MSPPNLTRPPVTEPKDVVPIQATVPAPQTQASRDELVVKYLPRIHQIARSLARRLPPHVPLDDLVSAGTLGLLDAAIRFDPNVCDRFEGFAEHRIRGAMLDELRSHDSLSRELRARSRKRDRAICSLQQIHGRSPSPEEIADELGMDMDAYERLLGRVHRRTVLSAEAVTRGGVGAQAFRDNDVPDPFQVAAAKELRDVLARALNRLPDRLRLVASLYYKEGLTLGEIGEILGVTEARACQLRAEAVRKLQGTLRMWEVKDE